MSYETTGIPENLTQSDNFSTNIMAEEEILPTPDPHVLYTCLVYRMVVFGVIMGVVCVVGFVGNFLSAYTMWPSRNTQSTSLLIICLACYDSIFLGGLMLNMSVTWFSRFFSPRNWWLSWGYPFSWAYIQPFTRCGQYCGSWTIVLITFQRYVAVCHPLKAKTWCSVERTKIQLIIITIVLFSFSLPRAMFLGLQLTPNETAWVNVKTSLGKERFWYETFYDTIAYFTLMYGIPVPSLIIMTYKLLHALKAAKRKRLEMIAQKAKKPNKISREEREITVTMIAVVVVYLLCQIPNPIRRLLLGVLAPEHIGCGYFYSYYHPWSVGTLILNSAVNVFLYYKFGKTFRNLFHARVRRLLCLRPKVRAVNETSLGNTENSRSTRQTHSIA